MSRPKVHVEFPGRIVFVGFGSIGQGVLPLILRHIGTQAERITIVSADERGSEVAVHFGVRFIKQAVTADNLRSLLEPLLSSGDFLINVSVDVSSCALVEFCHERGALYLDTCIEPWPGGYTDKSLPAARRTASSRLAVPITFVAHVPTGSSYDASTSGCAARCSTTSGWAAAMAAVSASASRTSPSTEVRTPSMPAVAKSDGVVSGASA